MPVWYTSLRRIVVQQHPTENTQRKQVNYKSKRRGKRKHRPKRAGHNPRMKAQTLMTQTLNMNTANALLRLLARLSPLKGQQVREHISFVSTTPPPLDLSAS